MKVFVRWRPLVGAETAGGSVTHGTTARPAPPSPPLLAVTVDRGLAPADKPWKSAHAFDAVLDGDASNAAAYATIVQPAVPRVMAGGWCSFFAYGHSGSGKTHTVIGYEEDHCHNHHHHHQQQQPSVDRSGPGLCLAAAEQLFAHIEKLNGGRDPATHHQHQQHPPLLAVGLSVIELRQKAAFDLLNDGAKCHIREGPDGKVHVRGETETLPGGRVRVRPVAQRPCWTLGELRSALRGALARRAVGRSSVHDQSSRTHAVLELEVVSAPLAAARAAVADRQSELVPVAKRATDVTVAEQAKGVVRDADGRYAPRPGYVVNQALIDEVNAEKAVFEARVAQAEADVDAVYAQHNNNNSSSSRLGGKMVFVDLAGAEYRQDSNTATMSQTPTERREARQINTDLLALKEVMRAWSAMRCEQNQNQNQSQNQRQRQQQRQRVPYRASPLTMVLRETFTDARHGGAGMVVTVSPATAHHAATLNSLKYGSLMGDGRTARGN
ncbi:kinesin family protein [Cordyceps javanica]|uniref:Kinesin-like protein n=1 Tax=Cordyceps javanica TaxID=43265 RepID=A0A545UWE7_9HYPO|nr:kinesin family protein [Cordyceps javanica]TQW04564.1 kinesin family protein [Cordyceps javanica]